MPFCCFRPSAHEAGDVSPIDEIPDMSQLTTGRPDPPRPESRTSIPMLRRERRKNSDAAANALRQQKSSDRLNKQARPYGHDVRWDPNTGEPTTSNKGRPSQVDPREFTQGIENRNTSVSPRHVKQAQQTLSAFGDRVRRMRGPSSETPQPQPQPEPAPAPRPEWRGASGRASLATPLQDSLKVAPLKIPPKSDKRTGPGPSSAAGSKTVSSPVGRSPRTEMSNGNGGATTSNTLPRTTNQTSAAGQQSKFPGNARTEVYPNSPVSKDHLATAKHADPPRAPQPSFTSHPEPPTTTSQPQPSLQVPTNEKATKRKSIGGVSLGHKPHPSGSSSVYSQPDFFYHPPPAPAPAPVDDWVQPPSRFSVTTYNTSNPTEFSYRASTDDEDAPPLPPPPPISTSPLRPSSAASGNSIMERGRPIVAGYEKNPRLSPSHPLRINLGTSSHSATPEPPNNSISSRPPPSIATTNKSYGTLTIRPVSRGGGGGGGGDNDTLAGGGGEKDLPPAPPETAGGDRVARLNARLQALGNRRINLHTAIRQMTELMPTDSVLASDAVARKREAEKHKIEALRRELADVERESYDLGLALHRAYKRLDRDAEYEPTTLWVRRVTG